MRIAMVSEHANPLAALGGVDAGGQNVHVDALAGALVARGHDVIVYTRRDASDALPTVLAPAGYTVHHVMAGPPTDIPKDEIWPHMGQFADELVRLWTDDRPDVAHAHFWMSGAATATAAQRLGIPWAQTFHALGAVKRRHQGPRDTSPIDRIAVETRLCAEADRVVATCRDEVAELERLGMPCGSAVVIPCGVDTDRFTPQAPPPERDTFQLLTIGRLVERKGVADVITALSQLPDACLMVAGGSDSDVLQLDPEVTRLRQLAEELGCADRVTFLGAIEHGQMPTVIGAADVVVAAPWYEPFGIVPLEAMACGRPVVGTAVGGLLDTIEPGRTGDLVAPRDPAGLAAAIRRLLDDPGRRRAFGRQGAARVRQHYTWPQVAHRTEQALAALVRHAAPLEVGP